MSQHLLIEHVTAVTMNPSREVVYDASIAIKEERIVEIGLADDLAARYPDSKRIDGLGKVALPGFINNHTHIAMSLQKGITLVVPDGIYRVMWPVEKNLTPEDVYIGALAGGAEALKGGSTTVMDHYFFAEETTRATLALGLRGFIGHTIMSHKGPIVGEAELEKGIDYVRSWKHKNPLVVPWLAPHAPDTVSKEMLVKLRQTASEEEVGLHLHVAQSQREQDYIEEQFGMSCLEYLESIEFLGPDVFAAHCIYIEDSDIDILAKTRTHPIYCPMTHSLVGKPARAWEMLQRGADVLIGTDCVTSNNLIEITGELRIAGAAQKQMMGNPNVMPSSKILEMVTVDAAQALGFGDQLGQLAPGYLADIILLDFDSLSTTPNYSLLDNIVYTRNGRDVNTVIVNGRIVVQDHKLLTVDEEELIRRIDDRGHKLISRAVQGDKDLSDLLRAGYQYTG